MLCVLHVILSTYNFMHQMSHQHLNKPQVTFRHPAVPLSLCQWHQLVLVGQSFIFFNFFHMLIVFIRFCTQPSEPHSPSYSPLSIRASEKILEIYWLILTHAQFIFSKRALSNCIFFSSIKKAIFKEMR